MKRYLVFVIGALLNISRINAQNVNGPFMSWDEFVVSFLERETSETDDENIVDEDMREWLERLAENPLQINRVEREELLAFPFLSEQQVDSLLAYRETKRGFRSLGEFQLVSGMDYYTRCYLSVFTRCDSMYVSRHPYVGTCIKDMLIDGSHELESKLIIPLYKRKGYEKPDKPTTTNYYVGNTLQHVVRYRYHYGREVVYGMTMEKDMGEPIAKQGFYPYDYLSFYVCLRPKRRKWNLFLGDYKIRAASGLLYGKSGFRMRTNRSEGAYRNLTFSPHTSTDESHFFRGIAYTHSFLKGWSANVFVSYRRLDARLSSRGDTVRSILYTGLHRTLSEIDARRTLGSFFSGAGVGISKEKWGIELSGCLNKFSLPIEPIQRYYNKYYFRGRMSCTNSLAYYVNPKHIFINGECAMDKEGDLAMAHHVGYMWTYRSHVALDVRYFSPKFVSLYASPIQQGTHATNEFGMTLSTRFFPVKNIEVSGYVDWFRFPKPTYQAFLSNSQGIDVDIQTRYLASTAWRVAVGYKLKSKQYTLKNDQKYMLEFRTTQRLRIASEWTSTLWDVNVEADASMYTKQTGEKQFGWMCSIRPTWKLSERLCLKGFAACFFTDDYESRLYAYQPQLPRSYVMQAFNNQGVNSVIMLNWHPINMLTLLLRVSTTKYFNRSTISSGLDEICSSWKNDVSIQVRWTIKNKKHGKFQ